MSQTLADTAKPKRRRNRGRRHFAETFNTDTAEHAAIRLAAKRDGRTLAGFLRHAALSIAGSLGVEVTSDVETVRDPVREGSTR